jgi:hypothetical protein
LISISTNYAVAIIFAAALVILDTRITRFVVFQPGDLATTSGG